MGPRFRGDDRQTPCPCFLGAGDGWDAAATEQDTEFLATASPVGARGLGAWMPARSVVRRRRGPFDAHPRDPAGTYTITITAASGNLSNSTTVNLTVSP